MLQCMNVDAMQSGLVEGTEDVVHLHSRIHYLRTGKRTGFRGLRLPFEERRQVHFGQEALEARIRRHKNANVEKPSDYRSARTAPRIWRIGVSDFNF